MAVVSYNESKNSKNNSLIVHGNKEELKKIARYVNHMHDKVEAVETYDAVDKPIHYCAHGIETINKIESVVDGLPAKQAVSLANILKYFDRAGMKDSAKQDLSKANNYAFRLVTGEWRKDN